MDTTNVMYNVLQDFTENKSSGLKESSTISPKTNYTVFTVYDIILHSVPFWILGFCSVIGTIGNVAVIGTIISSKSLHRPTFIVLCSLAIVDLLVVNVMFLSMTDVDLYWTNGWSSEDYSLWIDILQTSRGLLTVCSSYHLVVLAGVRYFIIVHPIKAQVNLSCHVSVAISVLAWLIPSVIIIAVALIGALEFDLDYLTDPIVGIIYCVFYYVIPIVAMSLFHCFKVVKLQSRNVNLASNSEIRRTFRQLNIMVAVVIILQLLLLFPLMLQMLSRYIGSLYSLELGAIAGYCQAVNSSINPYIYAFMCKYFRHNLVCFKYFIKSGTSTLTVRTSKNGTSV